MKKKEVKSNLEIKSYNLQLPPLIISKWQSGSAAVFLFNIWKEDIMTLEKQEILQAFFADN
jgi:hypothetical protein